MDEALQQPEPKISLLEIILIGIVVVISDLLELIPFVGIVLDVVVGLPLQLYLFLKGVGGVWILSSNIMEVFPGLQALPTRTTMWIVTVWIDHHPKLEAVAEKIGEVEALGEGAGVEAEVAEGKAAAAEAGGAARAEGGGAVHDTAEEAQARRAQTEGGTGATGTGRGGEVAEGGGAKTAESENARPSERSTEGGEEENQKSQRKKLRLERRARGEEEDESEDEQEQLEEEKAEDYADLMEPEAAKNPLKVVEGKLFAEPKPIQQETEVSEENESTRRLRERFEKKMREQRQKEEDRDAA